MNALHTQRKKKRGEKQKQQHQQWGGREAWWCLLDKAYLRDTQWTTERPSAGLIVHLAYLMKILSKNSHASTFFRKSVYRTYIFSH